MGHSATAGAAAGLIGEGSAMLLAEALLHKPTELLTAEEHSLLKATGLLYDGVQQGVVKAQIDGVTGVVETVEATVDAIKNLDQTIAGIQDVIANPGKAFDKIAM